MCENRERVQKYKAKKKILKNLDSLQHVLSQRFQKMRLEVANIKD